MSAKLGPLRPHEERLSYARHQPMEPPPGQPALGDSFLVVTEGQVTERMYFESIRRTLQINAVTVCVLHPACTDAVGLVQAAIRLRDAAPDRRNRCVAGNREVSQYDHVWVLFDTDVPALHRQLGPALELAKNEHVHVAHSNPSVEFWLLLHFRFTTGPLLNSDAAENAGGEAWGQHYDKREQTFPNLWPALKPRIPAAVSRAEEVRQYHKNGRSPFPPNPSTELDLLVRALDASVQPPLRILR